jgi:hypothetical protein
MTRSIVGLALIAAALAGLGAGVSIGAPFDYADILADRVLVTVTDSRSVRTYAITDWLESPEGLGCGGAGLDRPAWDDMVKAWYDAMTEANWVDMGLYRICRGGAPCEDLYSKGGSQVNHLHSTPFVDRSLFDWGRDHLDLDNADAVMVAWHGQRRLLADGSYTYQGLMNYELNNEGMDCQLFGNQMLIGNTDLEFLHFSSCHSLTRSLWPYWWQSFAGAHQITGFHGSMNVGASRVDEYQDFAVEAFYSTIADAWLDNHYLPDLSPGVDQCPVAYAVGADEADFLERISTERYNLVQRRPSGSDYWGAMWIYGCDPDGEEPLPDRILPFVISAGDVGPASETIDPSQLLSREQVRSLVARKLPVWDGNILKVNNGADWTQQLDFEKIIKAMGGGQASPNANGSEERILGKEDTVGLRKSLGKVFFISRERAWRYKSSVQLALPEDDFAKQAVTSAMKELGLPSEEYGQPRVARQIIGGAPAGSRDLAKDSASYNMYRVVTLKRSINNLPVYNSMVRAKVNHEGKIQYFKATGPVFKLSPRLKLQASGKVTDEIVNQIMLRKPGQGMELNLSLVYYVPTSSRDKDIKGPVYVPGIVAMVKSGPTPYEIVVPVAR